MSCIRKNTITYTASTRTCIMRCHVRHAYVLCDVCDDAHNAHDHGWATQSRISSCPSLCPQGHDDVQRKEHQNQGRVIVDIKPDISTSAWDVYDSTTMFLVTSSRTSMWKKNYANVCWRGLPRHSFMGPCQTPRQIPRHHWIGWHAQWCGTARHSTA